jgi:hypothetical protein
MEPTTDNNETFADFLAGHFDTPTVPAALTTDHPASSYGIPVLVMDGAAYGPADVVPGEGPGAGCVTAGQMAANLVLMGLTTAEMAKKYLSQLPPGHILRDLY